MEPEDLLRHVRDVCDRLSLTYLVVGSTATIAYGEPRFTNDIDIVVDLPHGKIDDFCTAFPDDQFYISRSAVEQAVSNSFQFNVIHPASGLKVDFIVLSDSAFDQSRTARRRNLSVFPDGNACFASPEDVIIKKLIYHHEGGSDKHLRDIGGVLRIQGDKIDRDYITDWAKKFGVLHIWDVILSKEADEDNAA